MLLPLFSVWLSVVTIWYLLKTKKWIVWWNRWNFSIRSVTISGSWKRQLFYSSTKRIYSNRKSNTVRLPFAFQNTKVRQKISSNCRFQQLCEKSRENDISRVTFLRKKGKKRDPYFLFVMQEKIRQTDLLHWKLISRNIKYPHTDFTLWKLQKHSVEIT